MNPFTVITKFFGNNNFSTAGYGGAVGAGSTPSIEFNDEAIPDGIGIIRSEITESNLILYKISTQLLAKRNRRVSSSIYSL